MQAYDSLAEWFEYLNDDCDYPKWSQYFIDGLSRLKVGRKGLELGCGSGYFARSLQKNGYEMSGADLSVPMLTKAQGLSSAENLRIPYFQADASNLKTPQKYNFILAPNDCFNYIKPEKLASAFKKIASTLEKEGVFWFDISSEKKLKEKVVGISADDREDVTYLSFNTLVGSSVQMDVTLFVKGKDGRFTRYDETHTQYIHKEENILEALAPYFTVTVEGHLGEEKEMSDRLNFICRKK